MLLADWVFAYGSLIWNPEISYREAVLARVHGFHRAFCIVSTRYRGTPEQPGMVLGLERGGSCVGVAFRLSRAKRRESIERLYEREMGGTHVYRPTLVAVSLADGRRLRALSFVANRASASYQRLGEELIVDRLARSHGQRGSNRDYAVSTHEALLARGVHDPRLARLVRSLRADRES